MWFTCDEEQLLLRFRSERIFSYIHRFALHKDYTGAPEHGHGPGKVYLFRPTLHYDVRKFAELFRLRTRQPSPTTHLAVRLRVDEKCRKCPGNRRNALLGTYTDAEKSVHIESENFSTKLFHFTSRQFPRAYSFPVKLWLVCVCVCVSSKNVKNMDQHVGKA